MTNKITAVEHTANQVKVHECNVAKGWFDKPVSFLEAMALLGTEISEAYESIGREPLRGGWQASGSTASEFADVYIRLLDDCSRFGVDLGHVVAMNEHGFTSGMPWDFGKACLAMYGRLRYLIEEYRKHGLDETGAVKHPGIARAIAMFYLQLQDTCGTYGVDLADAFEAKMAVNWQRPYRHGNKHA